MPGDIFFPNDQHWSVSSPIFDGVVVPFVAYLKDRKFPKIDDRSSGIDAGLGILDLRDCAHSELVMMAELFRTFIPINKEDDKKMGVDHDWKMTYNAARNDLLQMLERISA